MRILTDEQKARKKQSTKESYLRVKERDKESFQLRMIENQKRYAANNPDKVKETKAKHHAANKEAIAARKKAYRLANPERVKELAEASRLRNKEKRNAASRKWNRDNAERNKENLIKWKLENPENARIHDQNKRARKRYNVGSCRLSNGLASKLYKQQDGKCNYCKKLLIEKIYHMDHIMPLSLGGSHSDNNIQLLCQFCNLSKHNKHPDAYEKLIVNISR